MTPYSDIDLSILIGKSNKTWTATNVLGLLNDNLRQHEFVINSSAILTATIPVIKLTCDSSIEFIESEKTKASFKIKVDLIIDEFADHRLSSS